MIDEGEEIRVSAGGSQKRERERGKCNYLAPSVPGYYLSIVN